MILKSDLLLYNLSNLFNIFSERVFVIITCYEQDVYGFYMLYNEPNFISFNLSWKM